MLNFHHLMKPTNAPEEITAKINEVGSIHLDLEGFSGDLCLQASEEILNTLRQTYGIECSASDFQRKPDTSKPLLTETEEAQRTSQRNKLTS